MPCPAMMQWHPRINQIFVGCGGRSGGCVRTFYDTKLSSKGALAAASRAPRVEATEFMSVSSGRSSLSSVLSSCIMYDVTIFLAVETDCRHAGRQAVVLPLACCTTSSVVSHPQSAAWGTQDLCTQCSANVPRRPPGPATVQEAAGREGGRAAQIPAHGRQHG